MILHHSPGNQAVALAAERVDDVVVTGPEAVEQGGTVHALRVATQRSGRRPPNAFARRGEAGYRLGAGPQSIPRGRNPDGPRMACRSLPSVRIRYSVY